MGAKIRFGHSTQPFYEDSSVIELVKNVSGAKEVNLADYNTLDKKDGPTNKIGLGKFQAGGYYIGDMVP